MIIIECIQGSPEWHAVRCGKVTASRLGDMLAKTTKTKTGWGASRANYAAELVAERLTGTSADKFTNAAMAWGSETEPQARAMYEFMTNETVGVVGCVIHPTIALSLASPDGLVGSDGLIEIKCPNTATHIQTLLGSEIDGKYVKQMQWQMACTERSWCEYVSYDPRMPAEMQLYVRRVYKDDAAIREMEREVMTFLAEVDDTVRKLTERFPLVREAA